MGKSVIVPTHPPANVVRRNGGTSPAPSARKGRRPFLDIPEEAERCRVSLAGIVALQGGFAGKRWSVPMKDGVCGKRICAVVCGVFGC